MLSSLADLVSIDSTTTDKIVTIISDAKGAKQS